MIVAGIDLGTNTFHLVIADISKGFKIILRKELFVFIGKGGISHNTILPEAQNRAIEALLEFRQLIDNNQVGKVYAVATSAFRNAQNKSEILERILQETGITVNVIEGTEEAHTVYEAIRYEMSDNSHTCSLIMDIGGGSTEFIAYNTKGIVSLTSIEIGGQRLFDRICGFSDPLTPYEQEKVQLEIKNTCHSYMDGIKIHQPTRLIGVAGSFETFIEIQEASSNAPFDLDQYRKIADMIIQSNSTERRQIPGMRKERADMMVAACLLINFVLSELKISKINVSSFGLREGVILKNERNV